MILPVHMRMAIRTLLSVIVANPSSLEMIESQAAPLTQGEAVQIPSVRVKPSLQAVHWPSAVRSFKS